MSHPARVYLALLHYPVLNRNGEVVTSAVTNLDIHDMARVAKTFGMGGFFVVTPDEEQRRVAETIRIHWTEGYGARYNVDRRAAMETVSIVAGLDDAVGEVERRHGERPLLIATTAKAAKAHERKTVSAEKVLITIREETRPALLLFGTAWGFAEEVLERADFILAPISGSGSYNHLSVRSAASIYADRILGEKK